MRRMVMSGQCQKKMIWLFWTIKLFFPWDHPHSLGCSTSQHDSLQVVLLVWDVKWPKIFHGGCWLLGGGSIPIIDGQVIPRSPVELGSWSHYLQALFFEIPGGDRRISAGQKKHWFTVDDLGEGSLHKDDLKEWLNRFFAHLVPRVKRQLSSLNHKSINQRIQGACPKFGFATLRYLETEKTHLPNGGFFMVIYHGQKVKKHLKQIQGNGALSRFIARIQWKNTPPKKNKSNTYIYRNSMELSCDSPTQRNGKTWWCS